MAVIKQACPKCGQRVSGDESFYGTHVECPICSSKIFFPDPNPPEQKRQADKAEPKETKAEDSPKSEKPIDEKPPALSSEPSATQAPAQAVRPQTVYSEPPSATLSIVSMVLGILNAVTFCIPSIVLAPAAIICGHIALIKGKFSPIQPAPGRSMAITGLILGYLGMFVLLVLLVLLVSGTFDFVDWIKNRGAGG